jgi:hypothetical protein
MRDLSMDTLLKAQTEARAKNTPDPAPEGPLKENPLWAQRVKLGEWMRNNLPTDKSQALPADDLSWDVLVAEAPRLKDLLNELQQKATDAEGKWSFCANVAFSAAPKSELSVKARMSELVGWVAENPKLRSEAAYSLAYENLYKSLPDCRRCWCTGATYPAHPNAIPADELTWEKVVELEPRFLDLEAEAREYAEVAIPEIKQLFKDEEHYRRSLHSANWDVRGDIAVATEDWCSAIPELCSDWARILVEEHLRGYYDPDGDPIGDDPMAT